MKIVSRRRNEVYSRIEMLGLCESPVGYATQVASCSKPVGRGVRGLP
jgi:hypothetical protein